jgi:hypothetical protein
MSRSYISSPPSASMAFSGTALPLMYSHKCRSQWPRDRLVAGVAGSNPARGMDVLSVVLSCAGRGLCDGLITRPEESYHVSVCVIKKPRKGRPKVHPGL